MLRSDEKLYVIEDLQNLLDTLTSGMILKGRIIEDFGNNKYILRIRGYNIVMESERTFQINDEAELEVVDLSPKLKLSLKHNQIRYFDREKGIADITVY
ncbi:hypothetical protein KAJ27_11250 [bacterium]|nr:hypothetical protein [bacterium]